MSTNNLNCVVATPCPHELSIHSIVSKYTCSLSARTCEKEDRIITAIHTDEYPSRSSILKQHIESSPLSKVAVL